MVRALVILAMLVLAARPDAYAQDFPTRPITIRSVSRPEACPIPWRASTPMQFRKRSGRGSSSRTVPPAAAPWPRAALQNAQPDGHTLLIFSGAQHGVVPAIDKTESTTRSRATSRSPSCSTPRTSWQCPRLAPSIRSRSWSSSERKGRRPDFRIPRRRLALASHRRQDHRRDRDAGSGGALPGRSADDG